MAHTLLRQQAIALRNQGKTYTEIRKQLRVAKSTLSDWLNKHPLTEDTLLVLAQNIKNKRHISIEKIRNTKQVKREARLKTLYQEKKDYWSRLSQRELELAGLFLYWGEGKKNLKNQLAINNTDPKVLMFVLYWLENALQVPREKIRVELHLYNDMDINKEIRFWSQLLKIPSNQFYKPYIKTSLKSNISHKGHGHGTCGLVVNDVRLKEKIMMAIYAIADIHSEGI